MSGETGSDSFCLELPAKKVIMNSRLTVGVLILFLGVIVSWQTCAGVWHNPSLYVWFSHYIHKQGLFFFFAKIFQGFISFPLSFSSVLWYLNDLFWSPYPVITLWFSLLQLLAGVAFPGSHLLIWLHESDLSSLPTTPSPTSQKVRISQHLPSLCISARIPYKKVGKEHNIVTSGELAGVKGEGWLRRYKIEEWSVLSVNIFVLWWLLLSLCNF